MSIFKSEKFVPGTGVDLDLVAQELTEHFRERKYEVAYSQVDDKTWDVSITRGGVFKQALGLKSALKIELEQRPKGTSVRAGAGVFGKQAAASVISAFVAWPVLLTQVWGLIRESGLDDEAVRVVELSINRMLRSSGTTTEMPSANGARTDDGVRGVGMGTGAGSPVTSAPARYCPSCGVEVASEARFCPSCGAAREPSRA
jgi:zinc-ribbon domain